MAPSECLSPLFCDAHPGSWAVVWSYCRVGLFGFSTAAHPHRQGETHQAPRSSKATCSPPHHRRCPAAPCSCSDPRENDRPAPCSFPLPTMGRITVLGWPLSEQSPSYWKPQTSKLVFVKRFDRDEPQLWWADSPGCQEMGVITGSPEGPSGHMISRGQAPDQFLGSWWSHLFPGLSWNSILFI